MITTATKKKPGTRPVNGIGDLPAQDIIASGAFRGPCLPHLGGDSRVMVPSEGEPRHHAPIPRFPSRDGDIS